MLLRVGGTLHANDHAANAGIAVFFDAGLKATTVLDANACFSAIDTAVTCQTLISGNDA